MGFILSYWKPIACVGLLIATFLGGWHSNTIYQGYRAENAEIKAVDNLGRGEAAIIGVNQKIHKELSNDKDCAAKPLPAGIKQLLQ